MCILGPVYVMIYRPYLCTMYALITSKSVRSQHHHYQDAFIICVIMHDFVFSSQVFELCACCSSRRDCFLFFILFLFSYIIDLGVLFLMEIKVTGIASMDLIFSPSYISLYPFWTLIDEETWGSWRKSCTNSISNTAQTLICVPCYDS